eukprot:g4958.t1
MSATTASTPQLCGVRSLHKFKTHYVRNNRRSTEKNLRCFPCCNVGGHVTQGFCGRGCLFRITVPAAMRTLPGSATPVDPEKISCMVELSLSEVPPDGMPLAGQTYPASDIRGRLKGGQPEPWKRPYWLGSADVKEGHKDADVVVDFSFIPTHWHYGWRSNKHTNTYRHTCRIYVFHEIDSGAQLLCLGSAQEGAFTISSTKKRRPEVPPGQAADKQGRKTKPKKKRRKTEKPKRSDSDALTPPMPPSAGASTVPGLVAMYSESVNNEDCSSARNDGGTDVHAGDKTLSSIGFPNNIFESGDENSIGSRGGESSRSIKLSEEDYSARRTSLNSIGSGVMMAVDDIGDNTSSNSFDQTVAGDPGDTRLDKFSFDAEFLDEFSNDVARDAADASTLEGAARAQQRDQQRAQLQNQQSAVHRQQEYTDFVAESDRLETVVSEASKISAKQMPTTSTSTITCERIAAASKAAVAKLSAAQAGHMMRSVRGDEDFSNHRGIGGALPNSSFIRSISSQSMQSDKSMNDFIGAFDSFESDVVAQVQGEDGVIQQEEASLSSALAEALYIPPSRENSGSFLAFDKIDEDRLRAASATPSTEEGHGKIGNNSGSSHHSDDLAKDTVKVSTVIQEGKSGSVVNAPQVINKKANISGESDVEIFAARSASGSNIARAPVVGIGLGVEVTTPENRDRGRACDRRGGMGWLIEYLGAPRMIGFALGIVLIAGTIIVCVVLLVRGEGGGGGENAAAGLRPFTGTMHKRGGATRRSDLPSPAASGGAASAGSIGSRGGRVSRRTRAAQLPDKFSVMIKVQQFLRKCKARGVDVRTKFEEVSLSAGSGRVSKVDFKRVMSSMGMDMAADEIETLSLIGKLDTRSVPVHGFVGSLQRRLSPTELAEQQSGTHTRVLMNDDELEFAEHLAMLFNLIDTPPSASAKLLESSGKQIRRHAVHRGSILRALGPATSTENQHPARHYAELIPSLQPLLDVTSYEASFFAYKSHSEGDFIDVDEFVDFWFHHIPDHVREHVEIARGQARGEKKKVGEEGILFSTAREGQGIQGSSGGSENIDDQSGSATFAGNKNQIEVHRGSRNQRRRPSLAIPVGIRKPHHNSEFAIQIRLHSAMNLRSVDWASSKSDPCVLMALTGAGESNVESVWRSFPADILARHDERPVTLDLTYARSSKKRSTLSPVWSRHDTFVLVSTGLLTDREHDENTIVPPTLHMRLYDSDALDKENFIGELDHVLLPDNILARPSSSVDDAVSLLLKDPNMLSPGILPNLTFSVGLCQAVIVYIASVECPNGLLKVNSKVYAEIYCGEMGEMKESKYFLCRTATAAHPGESPRSGMQRFEWSEHRHALGIEDFEMPEITVVIYDNANEIGHCLIPLDTVEGVHHSLDDHALQSSSSSSMLSSPEGQSFVSLGYRILPRPKFPEAGKTLDPSEPVWTNPATLASMDSYTLAHHLVRLYPSTVSTPDLYGMMALDYASVCGHVDLVQWLSVVAPETLAYCSRRDLSGTTGTKNLTGAMHLCGLSEMSSWWPSAKFSTTLAHHPSLVSIEFRGSKKDLRVEDFKDMSIAKRLGMHAELTAPRYSSQKSVTIADDKTHNSERLPQGITHGTHRITSSNFLHGNSHHPFREWIRFERDNVFCFLDSAVSHTNWSAGLEPDIAYFELTFEEIVERIIMDDLASCGQKDGHSQNKESSSHGYVFTIGFSDACAWDRYNNLVQSGAHDTDQIEETSGNHQTDDLGAIIRNDASKYRFVGPSGVAESSENSTMQQAEHERLWLIDRGFPEGRHPADIRKGYGIEFHLVMGEEDASNDSLSQENLNGESCPVKVKKGDVVGCGCDTLTINVVDCAQSNVLVGQPHDIVDQALMGKAAAGKRSWWVQPSLRNMLHIACLHNAENVCEFLVREAAPALIEKVDADGCAPAHLAARVDALNALRAISRAISKRPIIDIFEEKEKNNIPKSGEHENVDSSSRVNITKTEHKIKSGRPKRKKRRKAKPRRIELSEEAIIAIENARNAEKVAVNAAKAAEAAAAEANQVVHRLTRSHQRKATANKRHRIKKTTLRKKKEKVKVKKEVKENDSSIVGENSPLTLLADSSHNSYTATEESSAEIRSADADISGWSQQNASADGTEGGKTAIDVVEKDITGSEKAAHRPIPSLQTLLLKQSEILRDALALAFGPLALQAAEASKAIAKAVEERALDVIYDASANSAVTSASNALRQMAASIASSDQSILRIPMLRNSENEVAALARSKSSFESAFSKSKTRSQLHLVYRAVDSERSGGIHPGQIKSVINSFRMMRKGVSDDAEGRDTSDQFKVNIVDTDPSLMVEVGGGEQTLNAVANFSCTSSDQQEALAWFADSSSGASQNQVILDLTLGKDEQMFQHGNQIMVTERDFVSFCMKGLFSKSKARHSSDAIHSALVPFLHANRKDIPLPKDKNAPLQKNSRLANGIVEAVRLIKSQHARKVKFSMASARSIEVALRKVEASNKRSKDKNHDGRISWMEKYGDATNFALDLDKFIYSLEERTGEEKPADEERREALLSAIFDLSPDKESEIECAQELRLSENFAAAYNRPGETGAFVLREMDMARFLSVPFEMLRQALVPEFRIAKTSLSSPSEGMDRNAKAVCALPLLQRTRLLYHAAILRSTLKLGFNRKVPALTGREIIQDIMDSRRRKEEEKTRAIHLEMLKQKRNNAQRHRKFSKSKSKNEIPIPTTAIELGMQNKSETVVDAVDVDEDVLNTTLTSKHENGKDDKAEGEECDEMFAQLSQGMVLAGDESIPTDVAENSSDSLFGAMADAGDESMPPTEEKANISPKDPGQRLAAALERLDAIRMA